jgi:5-(carboxyamino)imidazole ribonucleotide mutase
VFESPRGRQPCTAIPPISRHPCSRVLFHFKHNIAQYLCDNFPLNLSTGPGALPHSAFYLQEYNMTALVGIIMGSTSDWETMRFAAETLQELGIPHEVEVVSAHRTPDKLFHYAETAETKGLEVIIAGAGGAAHLPGMTAAKTAVPVLGVPVQSKTLNGLDSLLSIVQMPAGIPVGTLAIGKAGAINAALLAASIVGNKHNDYRSALNDYRQRQTESVLAGSDPRGHGEGGTL